MGATLTPAECFDVATHIIDECKRHGCRLDMRLLVDKGFPYFVQWRNKHTETHWKDLITAAVEEQLVELKHTPPAAVLNRSEQMELERRVAREIVSTYSDRAERRAAWQTQTGKSERALYRRLQ